MRRRRRRQQRHGAQHSKQRASQRSSSGRHAQTGACSRRDGRRTAPPDANAAGKWLGNAAVQAKARKGGGAGTLPHTATTSMAAWAGATPPRKSGGPVNAQRRAVPKRQAGGGKARLYRQRPEKGGHGHIPALPQPVWQHGQGLRHPEKQGRPARPSRAAQDGGPAAGPGGVNRGGRRSRQEGVKSPSEQGLGNTGSPHGETRAGGRSQPLGLASGIAQAAPQA